MTLPSARSASLRAVALFFLLSSAFAPAQTAPTAPPGFVPGPSNPAPPYFMELLTQPDEQQFAPVPMLQDRAVDSYKIFSILLPVGMLGNPGWTRDLWLLSDTTLALVPADQPCLPQSADSYSMNPHVALQAPPESQQDFNEMLDDFDRRCHERIQLTAEPFNLVVPLRLLTLTEQDEFIRQRWDLDAGHEADVLTARYKGAPGLSRFSQVYFNAHHTLAMVYSSGWCGGLCAQSYWQVLALNNGVWKLLKWHSTEVLS
jgi:hypothetical protein